MNLKIQNCVAFYDVDKNYGYNINEKNERSRKMLEKLLSNATFKNKFIVNYQFKSIYSVLANTPKNCDLPTLLGDLDSNQDNVLQRDVSYH